MTYSNNMVAMATQLYVNMQYYVQLNLDSQNLFTAHVKLFSLHTVKLNSFNMCNEVSFLGMECTRCFPFTYTQKKCMVWFSVL